jgi:hypothetical protein
MNIIDKINNPMKLHKKKTPVSAKKVIHLIRTGDYNPSNMIHKRMFNYALRNGYVDEDLNILKEAK